MSAIVDLLAVVGAVTIGTAGIGLAYYLATRRPTPNATLREAVGSIRWGHGFALLVAPPALVGAADGPGVAVLGAAAGALILLEGVLLSWWWGPI